MLGRNHVIANVSTLVIGYGLYINMKDKLPDVLLNNDVVNYFSYNGSSFTDMGTYILLSSILFLFGSLLPDIDEPKSMLGRRLHLPVKHRGANTYHMVSIVTLWSFKMADIHMVSVR